jgi:SAM-dependent methyltransferase
VIKSDDAARTGRELHSRYTPADLSVFTPEEANRFMPRGLGDPRTDPVLAWELLYRLEPALYDRLVTAERLHPGIIDWLPRTGDRIVEVGAGTGRLTLHLVDRAPEIVAVEPARQLREILQHKLDAVSCGSRVRVVHGFFDELPLPDGFAGLVLACSAFTPDPAHGGDAGLAEMERVCMPGGRVVIIWPNNMSWLSARGYEHVSFGGEMFAEFSSYDEAVELSQIFYPRATEEIRRGRLRRVPFEIIGLNPPRDLAVKRLIR